MKMFRDLSPTEEASFRAWARANYVPFSAIDGCWHPLVQQECAAINAAAADNVSEELITGVYPIFRLDCSE